MMRFGWCCGPAQAGVLKAAGFDYFEWGVPGLLMPLAGDAAFEAALAQARAAALPCGTLNMMVPGELKITGADADPARLEAYAQTMCARAQRADIRRIVFGSGGARRVPDGFCKKTAREQIIRFLKMLGPFAQAAGVTIVVEPLNTKETNIINSVAEGADIVREVNAPAIRLLADSFHVLIEDEPLENISKNLDIISHAHIATREGRLPPGVVPCAGVQDFLSVLRDGGYNGRVSVEGNGFSASNARVALATLRLWSM
ncbi:MAG: sugar phosphate isomerase/epimerase [Kiritimatiellaeota bacterium]|nr:sugar phosphate isomerase/epimerase [Kiritimatiellota bacterium]